MSITSRGEHFGGWPLGDQASRSKPDRGGAGEGQAARGGIDSMEIRETGEDQGHRAHGNAGKGPLVPRGLLPKEETGNLSVPGKSC